MSGMGETGGTGWVHPKGASSMAVSGLGREKPFVGAAWVAISLLMVARVA